MQTYHDMRKAVNSFMKANKINAYDLQRIAKDLCCCITCKHYVQHYSKEGQPVDFGHCDNGNIQHSKKPSTASCGSWEDSEEGEV